MNHTVARENIGHDHSRFTVQHNPRIGHFNGHQSAIQCFNGRECNDIFSKIDSPNHVVRQDGSQEGFVRQYCRKSLIPQLVKRIIGGCEEGVFARVTKSLNQVCCAQSRDQGREAIIGLRDSSDRIRITFRIRLSTLASLWRPQHAINHMNDSVVRYDIGRHHIRRAIENNACDGHFHRNRRIR